MRWLVLLLVLLATPASRAQNLPSDTRMSSRPLYQSLQQSLDTLSRAEIAVEEARLSASQETKLEAARQQCRRAISQLVAIETKLRELLRETYQIRPSQRAKNSWTLRELESLARNLKVQLARGYRNQALSYPKDSVDRLNSLSLALQQLPEVTMQPLDDASVWRARVEQVVCLRLINRQADATGLITRWQAESPPADIASRLQGERLRIALGEPNLSQARVLIDEIRKDIQPQAPETDDAILEAMLTLHEDAQRTPALAYLQDAVRQLQQITKNHGPFWQRRAEMRLGHAMNEHIESDDPRLLGFAAASLYAAQKTTEAITIYDRIAKIHEAQERSDEEFNSLETVAAILRETDQTSAALTRYRALAIKHSDHQRAASAHLTAIGLAGQLAQHASVPQRAEAFEKYLELLREHLELWPEAQSAEQVRQWLAASQSPDIDRQRARQLVSQRKKDEAIALYRDLLSDAPDDAQLLEEFASLLGQSDSASNRRESLKLWQQLEKRSKPGGPRWWRGRRARLALLELIGEGEQAEKLKRLTEILYQ